MVGRSPSESPRTYRAILRRSALTALVVGTVLVAINHGPGILHAGLTPALWWQVPVTYVVPFCVATWGAMGAVGHPASRSERRRNPHRVGEGGGAWGLMCRDQ
jgi:hypothetical protein